MAARARRAAELALLASGGLKLACGSGAGEGAIDISAFGEAFVEEGLGASEMRDGWAVSFERFAVSLGAVRVAGQSLNAPLTLDLARPSGGMGHLLGRVVAAEGDHGEASFEVSSLEVAGVARRAGEEKRFAWGFDEPTRYERCEAVTRVAEGQTARFELTFHADHLFYDSLVAEAPALRFQAIAEADVDGDGAVTPRELRGRGLGAYDPGSEDELEDLWAYLAAAARTVGHVDGEGHCQVGATARAGVD